VSLKLKAQSLKRYVILPKVVIAGQFLVWKWKKVFAMCVLRIAMCVLRFLGEFV
jgi:hypothetical protein